MLISMGLFGYSDNGVFKTDAPIGTMQNITLNNGIYDEFHIQSTTSGTFTTSLDNWTSSTLLLAKFQNSLSAGNIMLNGMAIDKLKIKKRKINTLIWSDVASITFDSDTVNYQYTDKLVESSETFEYSIIPCSSSVEGEYSTGQIDVLFDGAFLSDAESNYQLFYNYELGDINLNMPNSTVELLGSQYPIIIYSATTQYKSGSIRAMLISSTTVNAYGVIDVNAEKLYRNTLITFLTNKKPKILKSTDGQFMLISIIGTPKLSPNNDLNAYIYDLSFDFVECGNIYDYTTLLAANIIE